jgi:peptidoglycan/xylan/chitin deacetylase (PgdA/CDA1 family)
MRSRFHAFARRTVARSCQIVGHDEAGLRVLTYHRVNDAHPRDRLSVRPDAFAVQMEVLARSGRPVLPLAEAVPALGGTAPLPSDAIALTFDDGFQDNFTHALPVLERFGFPATFFIVTALVGSESTLERYRDCCEADRILDWEQVREMRARGQAIGGHGRTHREMAMLSEADARAEAHGCADDIAAETGERPSLFCYPRGSESVGVRRIVGEAGFEAACTVRPGANPPGTDLLALRRTEVSADDTIEDFRLKLDGGFDAWHHVVQGLTSRGPR